jgi:hypothetical protein
MNRGNASQPLKRQEAKCTGEGIPPLPKLAWPRPFKKQAARRLRYRFPILHLWVPSALEHSPALSTSLGPPVPLLASGSPALLPSTAFLTGPPQLVAAALDACRFLYAAMGPPPRLLGVAELLPCCHAVGGSPLIGVGSVGVEHRLINGDLLTRDSRFLGCRVIWIRGRRQAAERHQAGHQQ